MLQSIRRLVHSTLSIFGAVVLGAVVAHASDFSEPWKRPDRALVIDAYEYNPIDWQKLSGDKRIVGFINKGSDGLSPPYKCSGNETAVRLCKALWKRHAVTRELFHTRRTVAKALGLKWGAYHLGRPGNPIDQANNFIDFAEPAPDDLIALDIEENDPKKWMSLEDAETFARHIHTRLGRWPVLYTNGNTALYIAENRDRYKILSRLPLWYARYKPSIGLHFPKGHWQSYALWQFAAGVNCDARSCPYRAPGTPLDIDVNVASMSAEELRATWPFGKLVEKSDYEIAGKSEEPAETVPLPVSRATALEGSDVTVQFATLEAGERIDTAALVEPAAEPAEIVQEISGDKEIVIDTGETVPLPIWRSDARKKRANVTLTFVKVERVISETAVTAGLTSMRGSPFKALLGPEAETPAIPVALASYARLPEKVQKLRQPVRSAPPKYVPTGEISAAAIDDPGPLSAPLPSPLVSVAGFSRADLPVFLLRKLDGPDEVVP